MIKKTLLFSVTACISAAAAFAAEPAAPAAKPTIAKPCTTCHKAEAGALRGYFDNVAFKSKTIQLKIDESVELVKFDEDEIKVTNGEGKTGNGEFLRKIKKGHETTIEFVEKDGVKTAVKVIEKPPVKISEEMLIKTPEIKKLVDQGPEKGNYVLFDSRPLPRFQQGYIPTAVHFPFSAFDKMAEKVLPKDKNTLVVFYCQGPTCNLSPSSAAKALKLGYTNVKVYKDGIPGWQEKYFGVVSPQFLKEGWIDKDLPHVLLDVRSEKDASKGFIKGAVAFPAKKSAKLVKTLKIKKNAPVVVYNQDGGKDAASVAATIIKAGYKNVLVVDGGFAAWQAAKYDVASGTLTAKATYTPKPRPGEINLDEFKKYADQLPANVMIIDVRNDDEVTDGMLKTAKLIPAEEIKDRAAEIPKDKLIVTQCSTGVRAEMAYHSLKGLGYTNVKFVNATMEFKKSGSYKISKD
jgi:rhodanese-related sulfurtransferase